VSDEERTIDYASIVLPYRQTWDPVARAGYLYLRRSKKPMHQRTLYRGEIEVLADYDEDGIVGIEIIGEPPDA
jgi:uncharacterized protein YuzE